MPRLSVVAGPSLDALVPITVNSGIPHNIVSDAFEGQILAYIKGFTEDGNVESEYFQREDRKSITWSIQTQGRFLHPISADDVLFGNTFDRPLKLPWGSSAALKFMHFVDPTLEHDLTSSRKPWALSPLISTMPHLAHRRVPLAVSSPLASRSPSPSPSSSPLHSSPTPSLVIPQPGPRDLQSSKHAAIRNPKTPKTWPPFPPPQSLTDDTAQLHLTLRNPLSSSNSHSPSPSPHLSRQPSSSGRATPESFDSSLMPILAVESFDPGNPPSSTESPSPMEKARLKKSNRLSAASLSSLLSVNHEDKRERRDRKRTGKLAKHEQTLLELRTADRRRAYFRDASHRQELTFGPEDIFTTDFCYGFLQFAPTLSLNLPGGISFDLMHYWDGQPVRFVCCERKRPADGDGLGEGDAESDVPWGRVLWCVAIQLIPEEPQQPQPHAQDSQRGSRIANGETNGAESHYQSDKGDSSTDGVD